MTDKINEIDKILNQTNYDDDKDTLLKNEKVVCKKLNEFNEISATSAEDPELLKVLRMKDPSKIPMYLRQLYTLGMIKKT